MKRLAFAAALLACAPAAHAQSMNVPQIVQDAVMGICLPFADSQDLGEAIKAGEAAGYANRADLLPDYVGEGPTPERVLLTGQHRGTVSLVKASEAAFCLVGIHEASVKQIADGAEATLRAMGFSSSVDDREGESPASLWWRSNAQVTIAPSTDFAPGSEFVLIIHADPGSP